MLGAVHSTLRALYHRWLRPDPLEELKARGLVVGRNFKMMSDVSIDWSHCWHITIGDDVTLAPRVQLIAHDASTKGPLGYTRIGKITIGNRVFVGAGSIILPGVRIGDDVVIGAGSVVTRDVADGVIAGGNPARTIAPYQDWLARREREFRASPRFGEEYTLRQNVSAEKRAEMNDLMVEGIGYVE